MPANTQSRKQLLGQNKNQKASHIDQRLFPQA